MKVEAVVEIVRPARKEGGDRYESSDGLLTIYIPQRISRPNNVLLNRIKITFEDE